MTIIIFSATGPGLIRNIGQNMVNDFSQIKENRSIFSFYMICTEKVAMKFQ